MEKCSCYSYDVYRGGICMGTKEREACACLGNEANCDFYPEVREKAASSITWNAWLHNVQKKYGNINLPFIEWLNTPISTEAKQRYDIENV